MSEVRVNNLSNENNTGGPTISGITTYSSTHFFVPPQGDTESRPSSCPPGSLRFNTDSAKLEYYRGDTIGWVEIDAEFTEPLGGGTGSNVGLGHRAIFGGSTSPYPIEFITISTFGNSQDFGDLNQNLYWNAGSASRTRGLINGGYANVNTIQFITIASTGDAADFGDLSEGRFQLGALSSQTRSVVVGGSTKDTMDYTTIAHTGNAVDFGNLSGNCVYPFSASSTTRGIIAGGGTPTVKNTIDFITISTTGDAQDFGDLPVDRWEMGSQSTSATRAVFGGGKVAPDNSAVNTIEFITMATFGNAIDFGDLTRATYQVPSGVVSSPTRGLAVGGYPSPSLVIDSFEIATTGNSVDFGDCTTSPNSGYALSSGHGGL